MGILTCSADHLHLLMQLLASHGLQLRDIGHHLPADALFNRQRHIPLQSLLELLEQARAACPEVALEFGLLLAHQRAPASQPFQAVLQPLHGQPFWQLFEIQRQTEGDRTTIRLHWRGQQDWPAELPDVLAEVLLAALHQYWLSTFRPHTSQISLSLPGTATAEYYRPYLSCALHTGQPALAVHLPTRLLGIPPRPAQPSAASMTMGDRLTLLKCTNLLLGNLAAPPGLEQLSERLGTSERTLKRRLQHAGCHYQQLLSELRLQQAAWWLHEEGQSVTVVAARLGYSSIANFSKAFRKWSGATPSQIRRYGAVRQPADVDADA